MNTKHTESSFMKYTVGFILSVVLTLAAFGLVMLSVLDGYQLMSALLILAVLQMYVQLHFFLLLTQEPYPKWNIMTFLFMGLIVLILVIGSIWIMKNLNYNISPLEMDTYMRKQVDKGF